MFESLPEKFNYPSIEREILKFWEKNKIFEKSLQKREGAKYFTFYEGPPTVNGKPGIHHLMSRTIKDTVCRYKSMTGYYVPRKAGWDTHGLPVELAVEKELGIRIKSDIEKFGIDKFNAVCKNTVYSNIEMDQGWRALTERMGYWLDLDSAYITCTNEYIESLWWALKQFFDKGLIYKGFKVVPQSPTIETPLSSHELSLGYKDVRDPNCYLKLRILSSPMKQIENAFIIVWTTTPWTLFANVALAVGEDIDYCLVKNTRKIKEEITTENYVLAKSRLNVLDGEYEILSEFKGKDILGTVYEQIFEYLKIDRNEYPNALTVLPGDFVSIEEGSGVVHLAPAFGEDDLRMASLFNLPFLQPVTPNGHFTEELGEFAHRAIKNFTYEDHDEEGADKDIIISLKYAGKIYKATYDYVHSYPHCWRTGNPIMYYARESWFIKSPEYKERMIEHNKKIRWQPPEIGTGRFGNWLEEVKEWALSRDRYWGTPLPIWIAEDGSDMFAIGSIEELMEGTYIFADGTSAKLKECNLEIDLHRPFVDNIIFEKNGKIYRRVKEVIDVWFDSGAMPFAQFHYPFENKEEFERMFPADFIAEGIDQTRGWFYTLHNIAVALFDKPAFTSIVVNELILDKTGQKMSKSKKNTVDPFLMMDKYGADALRWYLLVNNPPWKPTLFNEEDIARTVISDFLRSLTNTYAFFSLYANIDGFSGYEPEIPIEERPEIDKWIISRMNSLVRSYRELMEEYELTKAQRAIQEFTIYELSNWYVRRNRRRFWKGEKDKEKIAAYQTLRSVLIKLCTLIAPTAPFISEYLYQKLRIPEDKLSIHLLDLPEPDITLIDSDLERKMEKAQIIVNLVRNLREKIKIRVRQPLRRILIPVLTPQERRDIESIQNIVIEEVNIKAIEFITENDEIVRRKAKPNFKSIGKKFGKLTQKVAEYIKGLKEKDIKQLEQNKQLELQIDNEIIKLELQDIEIYSEDIEGWLVASEQGITVALDTQLDEQLIDEGIAREFINRIQNYRKSINLDVTDRISIKFNASDRITKAILNLANYIKNETLAIRLEQVNNLSGTVLDLDIDKVTVTINKV